MKVKLVKTQDGQLVGYRMPQNVAAVDSDEFSKYFQAAKGQGMSDQDALDFAKQNVNYSAGVLPEVNVVGHQPGVKHVYYRDVPGGNRVVYNKFNAAPGEIEARHAGDIPAAAIAAPMTATVGASLGAVPAYTSVFPAAATGTAATTAGVASAHTPLLPLAIGGSAAAMSSCSDGICNYNFGDKDMPTGGVNLKTYWYNDNETDEDMKNVKGGRVFLYGFTPYKNDSTVGFYSWLDNKGNRYYRQRTLAQEAFKNDLGGQYEDPNYLGITGKFVNIYDLENAQRKYQNK